MKNGKLVLFLWIVAIVVLAGATVVEKYCGTDFAHRYIYGSWWFVGLWAALAAGLLAMVFSKGGKYSAPTRLLHLSFVVILAGALCTKLWGERGQIILQKNAPAVVEGIELPFAVSLDTFYIQYYAGTNTPADYVSEISVEGERAKISMNNIYSHEGYRFYQSSFIQEVETYRDTSVLSINHDPVGIAVTYSGYALFVLAGLWLMFNHRLHRFTQKIRVHLCNLWIKKTAKICAICLICVLSIQTSRGAINRAPTITKTQAEQFGNLSIQYDGKITSVSAFAHDFALKLTGKTDYEGMNAEQLLMDFLFFPEKWQIAEPKQTKKEIEKYYDKIQLLNLLHSGVLLQMFPIAENGKVHWYYPTENFPPTEKQENITFIRTILTDYYTALHNGGDTAPILQRIADFQQQNAAQFLPSERHKEIEMFYLRHNFIKMLFMVNLAGGILALILMLFGTQNEQMIQTNTKNIFVKIGKRLFSKFFLILLIHSFCFLTLSIALRTYIGGRLPFATGAETMLIVAWLAMLLSVIAGLTRNPRSNLALPFGLIVSGCALLVAHLSMSNPKITPLVPVLQSPLLSLHVSVIIVAYTLLAFTALNSLLSVIAGLTRNPRVKKGLRVKPAMTVTLLRPALFLLGTGIFIGAVWANVSWGTYWSWDPKEVWALITFMTYSLALHVKMSEKRFHLFILLSFLTVLITYFGVNYFFGGMHGYG